MTRTHSSRTRHDRLFPIALLIAGVAVMLADAPATAQDALGRGDALDANPGVGTGGRNQPIPTPDFRSRNLLITGDVAGGRAFRDSVGYRADTDFRDALGSDDLFRFRADSALGSPRFAGLGRVADPFRFGQDLAMLEYRRSIDTTPRTFRRDGIDEIDPARQLMSVPGDDRDMAGRYADRMFTVDPIEVDRLRQMQSRDTSARPVGAAFDQDGGLLIASASPLFGISYRDERAEMMLRGVPDYDIARLRDDAMRGMSIPQVGTPRDPSFREQLRVIDERLVDRQQEQRIDDTRVVDRPDPPHVEILKRIAQRYAGLEGVQLSIDASLLEQLDEEFAELRQTLQAMRSPRQAEQDEVAMRDRFRPWIDDEDALQRDTPRTDEAPDADEAPGRIDPLDSLLPERPEPRRPRVDDPDDEEQRPRRQMDQSALQEKIDLLKHEQAIDRLAPPDGTRLNELILSGQSSLGRGDYFNAENRFARALRLEPGHPMASAGMVHAQLGAGLKQAAAITLRKLLISYPELIDARYEENLLPRQPRLSEIIESLEAELDDDLLGDQYGLLLGYLGHQHRDREMVRRGLEAMQRIHPEDPLLPLIRGLWLVQDEDEDEDESAPKPDAQSGK